MERVEIAFIKHFSNANRAKGMKILRPKVKRERHRTSFSTGNKIYVMAPLGHDFPSVESLECRFLSLSNVLLKIFRLFRWLCGLSCSSPYYDHSYPKSYGESRQGLIHGNHVSSLQVLQSAISSSIQV